MFFHTVGYAEFDLKNVPSAWIFVLIFIFLTSIKTIRMMVRMQANAISHQWTDILLQSVSMCFGSQIRVVSMVVGSNTAYAKIVSIVSPSIDTLYGMLTSLFCR